MESTQRISKAFSTLISGSLIAILVGYLVQPVLTRLYSPESFGQLDVFISMISLLIPFASLRYEDAIMIPEREEEAAEIFGLSVLLVLIFAGLLALFTLLLPWPAWLEPIQPWALLLPAALLLMRLGKLMELWLNRKKHYGAISSGQALQSVTTAGMRVSAGWYGLQGSGLIGGYLAGLAGSLAWWSIASFRSGLQVMLKQIQFDHLKETAKRYKRFPLFSLPSTFFNQLITRLPFLLLLYFFDATVVGYYGRAFVVLAVPLGLVGGALSQIFFVEGAGALKKGELPALSTDIHQRLVLIGIFPTLVLIIAAPPLFGWVFGETWIFAGHYLQILAPWLFLASIASPLTRIFDIREEQRLDLILSLCMAVILTVALVIGGQQSNILRALFILSCAGSVARILQLIFLIRLCQIPLRQILLTYGRALLLSAPGCILLLFATDFLGGVWLFGCCLIIGGIYIAFLWLKKLI